MKKLPTPQSRYALLASALLHQIEQGNFPVDSFLPTETELAQQFIVSRHTVREALRQLQKLGVIISKQGSGSKVVTTTPVSQFVQSANSIADFMELDQDVSRKVIFLNIEPIAAELADKFQLSKKQLWQRSDIILKTTLPIMLSKCYVDAKYSEFQLDYCSKKSCIKQMQEHYGLVYSELKMDMSAILLNKDESQRLKVPIYSAALKVIRGLYDNNNELVLISINISPAERYSYATRFQVNNSGN